MASDLEFTAEKEKKKAKKRVVKVVSTFSKPKPVVLDNITTEVSEPLKDEPSKGKTKVLSSSFVRPESTREMEEVVSAPVLVKPEPKKKLSPSLTKAKFSKKSKRMDLSMLGFSVGNCSISVETDLPTEEKQSVNTDCYVPASKRAPSLMDSFPTLGSTPSPSKSPGCNHWANMSESVRDASNIPEPCEPESGYYKTANHLTTHTPDPFYPDEYDDSDYSDEEYEESDEKDDDFEEYLDPVLRDKLDQNGW